MGFHTLIINKHNNYLSIWDTTHQITNISNKIDYKTQKITKSVTKNFLKIGYLLYRRRYPQLPLRKLSDATYYSWIISLPNFTSSYRRNSFISRKILHHSLNKITITNISHIFYYLYFLSLMVLVYSISQFN